MRTLNLGVCNTGSGACEAQPIDNGTSCSDGNLCSAGDTCQAGTCTAGASACGAHATGCTAGTPNTCACQSMYVDNGAGQCVPQDNECLGGNTCATASCGANVQSCSDPTPACDDWVCTCNPGYHWNGSACVRRSHPNPRVHGSCSAGGTPGSYTCGCSAGYQFVNDPATPDGEKCVCDMDGTFALRISVDLQWPATVANGFTTVEAGSETTYAYAIRRHTGYAADGSLAVETILCGGTTPDICGPALPLLTGAYAYAQYNTNQMWDSQNVIGESYNWSLPAADDNGAFVTPLRANTPGVSLTDPMGDWPASRQNVLGGSGARTNGAQWVNSDTAASDTKVGVTSYAVRR